MSQVPISMPDSHIASLAEIEAGYWWFVGRTYWATQLLKDYLRTHPGFKPSTYCDLGCGTGGFAHTFSKSFSFEKKLLVDGDPKVLSLTQRYPGFSAEKINFSGPFNLPFSPDVSTCMDVLEHIEDDRAFLNKAASQMKKDSLLIASVPACPSFYSEWDKRLGHFRRYTKKSLTSLVEGSGFEIKKITFMWSFLSPVGPIRKLRKNRYENSMEFEAVPAFINETLIQLSKMEYSLGKIMPLPIGTSLICLAVRKS